MSMTQNDRRVAQQVVEMIRPALRETKSGSGRYETQWGLKTIDGLIASIQAILAQAATS